VETPRVFLYNTVRHAVDCPVLSPTVSHVFATLRATPAADISFVICLVHTSSSSCAEGTTYCAPLPFHRRPPRPIIALLYTQPRTSHRARASVRRAPIKSQPTIPMACRLHSASRRDSAAAGSQQYPIPLHPPSLGAMRRLLTRAGRLGMGAPVLPPPPRETVVVIGLASCRPQAPGLLVRVEM